MEAENTKRWEGGSNILSMKDRKDGGKRKKNKIMTKWIEEKED